MTQTALIFPGQGSQAVGMLSGLAAAHDLVQRTFDEASDVLDRDLWRLVCDGPEEELNRTEWTQPAVLAADIAIWRIYRDLGGAVPGAMAGHSLGEYAALVAAGAMRFADAVAVVHRRGQLMQAAVREGEGGMAAILGLDDADVERICAEVSDDDVVVPANYNSPGQLVIAGATAAVARAVEACSAAGARRALVLPVSVPSHTPLMEPAMAGLSEALDAIELSAPECPVLHNLDMRPRDDAAGIRSALVDQLTHPVHWTGTIRALVDNGHGRFLECGPGRVLGGLGKRIERGAEWIALDGVEALASAASQSTE